MCDRLINSEYFSTEFYMYSLVQFSDLYTTSLKNVLTVYTMLGSTFVLEVSTIEYIDLETTYRLRHISGGGELGNWKFQPPLHTSTLPNL